MGEITLSEKTRVPVSLVIIIVTVVVWFIRLEGRVDAQAKQIDALTSIDRRLARIEGRLGISTDGH